VALCDLCLAGTQRCPSCQRRFADTEFQKAVVAPTTGAHGPLAKPGPKTASPWTIAAMVAMALVFGMRAVRALMRSQEPAVAIPPSYEIPDDPHLQELIERTRVLAEATPTRWHGPAGAPCAAAPVPQPASFREGDDLSHALRLHLSTAGQGAAIEFLDEVPFDAPTPMAFPPDEQLQLSVLAWRDPTPLRGGSVRAVVALRDRAADLVRCRADIDIQLEAAPGASIDAARFDLLWTALRRGASQLRTVP
jgi:hypothetical protein